MPSRLWYVVAVVVLVVGVAAGFRFMVPRVMALSDDFIRVVVPGEHEIELSEAGSYTIFHEPSGTVDGVLYAANDISGLRVSLTSAMTGEDIALGPTTMSSRYSAGGRTGFSVFGFEIAAPGAYRLSAAYEDGRTQPSTILAISSGFVGKLVTSILVTLAIVLGSAAAAVAIGIRTFLKRRRMQLNAGAPPRS